ncbi:MAG: DUF305 domain-containing protein [Paracoccaceae bacterium]
MRRTMSCLALIVGALAAGPALAHVKWFAPFIVGAAPRPVGMTLADPWFWAALGLVAVLFAATLVIEATAAGEMALAALDRLTGFLWDRADDLVRVAVGTFFVATFAVGGVYLTPDLATPAEWVSWFQLLIAAGLFWRATMPLSGLGILALWAFALSEYEFFHLLDYLALGIGEAGYLVFFALPDRIWRERRFAALTWGVAVALMWSSLEKFAYPEWFHPLVLEKPFLTFGLPRDVFIPMAGVAEFTLGFGLLWTPLVRRLSAIALLGIFLSAVWPFGRTDMLGHALIMSAILICAVMPGRGSGWAVSPWRRAAVMPAALAGAMAAFIGAYWGAHLAIYGAEGAPGAGLSPKSTHAPDAEHPHDDAPAGGGDPAPTGDEPTPPPP